MRVWDIHPKKLCRNHLLGEHREIHAIWVIIIENKRSYRNHPETLRWRGRLKALYLRHQMVTREMCKRGYNHNSPLAIEQATGEDEQNNFINSIEEQIRILKGKKCECKF
jgi:hypothetical protein